MDNQDTPIDSTSGESSRLNTAKAFLKRITSNKISLIIAVVIGIVIVGTVCLLISGIASFFSSYIGSSEVVTTEREVSSFENIVLEGQGKIIIKQGKKESIKIEAPERIISKVSTTVDEETLTIKYKRFLWFTPSFDEDVIFHVTVKDLESISVSGIADLEVQDMKTGDIAINLAGETTANIGITARELALTVSGESEITSKGTVDIQDLSISGAGDYHGYELKSKEALIDISGSGDVEVRVTNILDIDISGNGSVLYRGNPTTVNQTVSGNGTIERNQSE